MIERGFRVFCLAVFCVHSFCAEVVADDFARSPFYSGSGQALNDRSTDSLEGIPESEQLFFLALRRTSESYNNAKTLLVAALRQNTGIDSAFENYKRTNLTVRTGLMKMTTGSSDIGYHFKSGLGKAAEEEQKFFERAVSECKSGVRFDDLLQGDDVAQIKTRLVGLGNVALNKIPDMPDGTKTTIAKILRAFDPAQRFQ